MPVQCAAMAVPWPGSSVGLRAWEQILFLLHRCSDSAWEQILFTAPLFLRAMEGHASALHCHGRAVAMTGVPCQGYALP